MVDTIGNPVTWAARLIGGGARRVEAGTSEISGEDTAPIVITGLRLGDLRLALRSGLDDFMALRTDVMFIVVIYPIIGLMLMGLAMNRNMLPMVLPMISGFALLGPVAAVGLYEMSRRREMGLKTTWGDALGVLEAPSIFPILVLGFYLFAVFIVWLIFANSIYSLTLGPEPPASLATFGRDIFTTSAGWVMLIVGCAVGFVFAATVLTMSLISFPLLVDRHVGLVRAVVTSITIARRNPVVVAAWGAIVVVALGVGVATMFVGLIVVLPVLGHASWHLYRRAVAPPVR
ncbi:DUF2189 domain-containing protein [bacterium]|nr:DUF2189 domain-containing protein [bacterium]